MGTNKKTKKRSKKETTSQNSEVTIFLKLIEDAIRQHTPPERIQHLEGFSIKTLDQALDIYRLLAVHNRELEMTINDMQSFIDEHMGEL